MKAEGFSVLGEVVAMLSCCEACVLRKNRRSRKKRIPTTARIPAAMPMAISQRCGVDSAWNATKVIACLGLAWEKPSAQPRRKIDREVGKHKHHDERGNPQKSSEWKMVPAGNSPANLLHSPHASPARSFRHLSARSSGVHGDDHGHSQDASEKSPEKNGKESISESQKCSHHQ